MSERANKIRAAVSVMDGAATLIGSLRADLQRVKDEATQKGVDLPALDDAIANLERETAELTSAMAENTSAAPAENPTPDTAPEVKPEDAPSGDPTS